MFTGIIAGTGKVQNIMMNAGELQLVISPIFCISDYIKGESIAVNGVCLTVEEFTKTSFTVYASKETSKCTNLKNLRIGSLVNLERALRLMDRLGGHVVSGHIDCLATISQVDLRGKSIFIKIIFPVEFKNQIVTKGSITLDGVSLTINECGDDFLEVNIIPTTQVETTINKNWQKGYQINMETDVLAKYIERILGVGHGKPSSSLNRDFLLRHGF